jgi:hypothetical protein
MKRLPAEQIGCMGAKIKWTALSPADRKMEDGKIADLIFPSSIFLSARLNSRYNDQSHCSEISMNSARWGVSEPQLEAKLDDARTVAGSSDLADAGS